MEYKLENLIDIRLLQELQEKLNAIYSFPSAIIDNDGKILTAVAWQDICTKFHRIHSESEKECRKSDLYIREHLHEANPAVSYKCPHGMIDNASPIIIDGKHLGNFFTGQFFLDKPDMEFFRKQAAVYGFDEEEYLEAVRKVPIWTKEKLAQYLDFIKGFIEIIAGLGLKNLKEIKINADLKEIENRYKSLFFMAVEGISIVTVDGRLVEVNESFAKMHGYSLDEISSITLKDFETPESSVILPERMKLLLNGEKISFEANHFHKDGYMINLEISACIIHYGSDSYIQCFNRDITKRKKVEAALRDSENKYRSLYNSIRDAILVADKDRKIIDCNNAFTSLFGYSLDEIKGLHTVSIYENEEEFVRLGQALKKHSSDTSPFQFRVNYRKKNGDVFPGETGVYYLNDNKGDTQGFIGWIRDITKRLKAEDEIKESRDLLSNLASLVPGVVYQYRLYPDGSSAFPYSSPGMYDIYGYYPEDVREDATPVFSRVHPDDLQHVSDLIFESAATLNTFYSEFRVVLPGQGLRWRWSQAQPQRMPDGSTLWHGIISDITERKKAEEEIKESEYRLVRAEKTAKIGNWKLLLNSKEVISSEGAGIIYGIENLAISLNDIQDIPLPEYRPILDKALDDLTTKDIPYDLEFKIKRQNDGSIIDIHSIADYDKQSNIIYGVIHDITERKQAENALRESEERYRSMVKILPDGIVIHIDGKIVYANDSACKIMKAKSIGDIIGRYALDFVHPDYKDIAIQRIKKSLTEQEITESIDEIFITFDGQTIFVNVIAIPFNYLGKSAMMVVFNDISERKYAADLLIQQNKELESQYEEYMQLNEVLRQTNHELKLAKSKAEESDKLKTAFLQNMSHEIRTPLNGIIGFSKLLLKENISKDEIEEFTTNMQKSGNRLIDIVNNVLDISKIETGQVEINYKTFSLDSLMVDLYQIFSPMAELKDLTFSVHFGPAYDNLTIISDQLKLNQILNNLIDNAIKFTKSGSIDFGYNIIEGSLQLFVKDTGIGLSLENQEIIFDRFSQVETSLSRGFEGAGLGLAICKGLVELLGGSIRVESQLNIGSCFYVTIPYISQTEGFKSNKNEIINPIKSIKSTILIVDDDDTSIKYLWNLLKKYNPLILKAENGLQAVEIFKSNPDIDLVLMDIKMPVMDGYEATRQIKKIKPEIPIIAQTAYAFVEEKERILAVGCDDYISKPIDSVLLIKLIEKYVKSKI